MGMTACRECGESISSKAEACPKCGAPNKAKPTQVGCGTVIFLSFAALVGVGALMDSPPPPQDTPAMVEQKERDRQIVRQKLWIEHTQGLVRAKLKDPGSADFQDVYIKRRESDGVMFTCGRVNSKNGFGGFTGFQGFISAGTDDLTFIEEQTADFSAAWNKFCL